MNDVGDLYELRNSLLKAIKNYYVNEVYSQRKGFHIKVYHILKNVSTLKYIWQIAFQQ